jgi:hypothetical protein
MVAYRVAEPPLPGEADVQGTHLSTSKLRTTLEEATGLLGKTEQGGGLIVPRDHPLMPGASVKFPKDLVLTVDRVNMWVGARHIRMGMWPAEVQNQYQLFYANPKKVEAVLSLADSEGWEVNSNFHIAYWHAQPTHRWYPHLGEPARVRQWIDDIRRGRANARTRQEIEDRSFRRWLVDRGFAHENELPTLDEWLSHHATVKQFFIRPGVQVLKTWPLTDTVAADRSGGFIAEVHEAIDRVLSALGEPRLSALQPHTRVKGLSARPLRDAKTLRETTATQTSACPTCHTVHAGECL